MSPILVLYATGEGHTRTVAEHVTQGLQRDGFPVECRDVAQSAPDPHGYSGAIVLASLHAGGHERAMVAWVQDHRETLLQLRCAFLSIGLYEAVAESPAATPERREAAAAEMHAAVERFFAETGWRPTFSHPVAGALPYTHVGVLKRLFLWWMAHRIGLPDDVSRDHVLTDWRALDSYVAEFTAGFRQSPPEL